MACLPAIATTACFVALILLDLYNHDWRRIPGHALFGVFAVLLILFICEKASHIVAWILLGSPFILVLLGYLLSTWLEQKPTNSIPVDPPNCPCCRYNPCSCNGPKPTPCWKPKPGPGPRPGPKPKPKPKPEPKPDNCIQSSLA